MINDWKIKKKKNILTFSQAKKLNHISLKFKGKGVINTQKEKKNQEQLSACFGACSFLNFSVLFPPSLPCFVDGKSHFC